jgi:hypothetical protein
VGLVEGLNPIMQEERDCLEVAEDPGGSWPVPLGVWGKSDGRS